MTHHPIRRLFSVACLPVLAALLFLPVAHGDDAPAPKITADEVLTSLKTYFKKTAQADGSFRPGIDPNYKGMADCALSDLAAVTYAVTLHKTFGWRLPREQLTVKFLLARQAEDGAFFNVQGTGDPKAPLTRLYNTTQGVIALHALGVKPKYDPLPVFEAILNEDYQKLPPYTTSFFPLAYQCCGKRFPVEADKKIRALMVQAEDGYLNDHIAATFHLAHYYRLLGVPTPRADRIMARVLHDQKPDGSWMLNPPARDRHAGFDAVFCLKQLGKNSSECQNAMHQATAWALSCRNADGGFGHYPGSPSDTDGVYFNVGILVMTGFLPPASPLPKEPQLLSWGHLMPIP